MSLVALSAFLCAALAHIYRVMNPSPRVPDAQTAALYLRDAKLKLSEAQAEKDVENADRLLVGAEFDLVPSELHATKVELSHGGVIKAR
jgi:hypothetical protein